MASGSIISDCPICREFIWEDQDYHFDGNQIKHKKCDPDKVLKILDLYRTLSRNEKIELKTLIAKLDHHC